MSFVFLFRVRAAYGRMGKESPGTQLYGTGSLCCARQIYVVALRLLVYMACVLCCAAPQAPSPQLAVIDTVSDLSHPHSIVMRRLFDAAHGLLASGDAGGAMRVATLCRRLANGDIDVKLAAANLHCRAGDILGAHAGFLLVWALARKQCPDPDLTLARDGVSIVRSCSEEELHDAQRWMVSSSASHGMCLMEARRFDLAAVRFRDALAIDQGLEGVAWHLGLACEYGGHDWRGAVEAYLLWLRIQRAKSPQRAIASDARSKEGGWHPAPPAPPAHPADPANPAKKTVAIFCLHRTPDAAGGRWGRSSLEQRGIGGSEEAVILVSRELVALRYHVEVYAYPPDDEMGADKFGVHWLPVHAFDPEASRADIFISWRGYALATQGGAQALNFLWLHDRVIPQLAPPVLVAQLAGILVLSEHHKAQLPPHALPKAILTRNGVASSFWRDGPNTDQHFIFASHPERGLEQLLEVWSFISAGVPGARLDIYHGFPDAYGQGGAPENELLKMRAFRVRVERLLKQLPGVAMHGMVNQSTLALAYSRAGFWLYPTSMPETSCISAMKAMGNGAIPITSRLPKSGLVETTAEFDLGPRPARPEAKLESDHEMLIQWAHSVIDAVRDAQAGKLKQRRKDMVRWARHNYSWSAVARQWSLVFQELSQELSPPSPSPSIVNHL